MSFGFASAGCRPESTAGYWCASLLLVIAKRCIIPLLKSSRNASILGSKAVSDRCCACKYCRARKRSVPKELAMRIFSECFCRDGIVVESIACALAARISSSSGKRRVCSLAWQGKITATVSAAAVIVWTLMYLRNSNRFYCTLILSSIGSDLSADHSTIEPS